MTLKIPLPDEVFQRWLKSKSIEGIEKVFGRKPNEISPMEVVGKEIRKSPALRFKTVLKKTAPIKSQKAELYMYQEAEKQKYYKFTHSISKNEWKEKSVEVFTYEKIEEVPCTDCGKKGLLKCDKCNGTGFVVCSTCKDSKNLQCHECKGSGSLILNFDIFDETGKKIDTKERKVTCPNCHGKTKFVCQDCGGMTKLVCRTCKGECGVSCKGCNGTGILYKLPLSPVPISGQGEVYFFWDIEMEKQISKSKMFKGEELSELLEKENISPIKVNNIADLNQKKLEDQLGFWDKESSRQIGECKKTFESLLKNNIEDPKYPIELYPLQKIDIETYIKKKFIIYSIGSQEGYIVFDLGF